MLCAQNFQNDRCKGVILLQAKNVGELLLVTGDAHTAPCILCVALCPADEQFVEEKALLYQTIQRLEPSDEAVAAAAAEQRKRSTTASAPIAEVAAGLAAAATGEALAAGSGGEVSAAASE